MQTFTILGASIVTALALTACRSTDTDSEATQVFTDCLTANGIAAEDVTVEMVGDKIETISLVVVSEGDVPYEPTVRLVCTQLIENS